MRFGVVEGLDGDAGYPLVAGEAFGIAASLAANEEGDLAEFPLGIGRPAGVFSNGGDCRLAEMRGCRFAMELEVVAEHRQQVFLQTHHQRVYPRVEDHVGTFETHLRRVARREILNVDGSRDDRAGDAETLGDVAFHLGAEHQIGLKLRYLGFDFQVVVGDQGFDAVVRSRFPDLARQFAAVGAEAGYREAQFLRCYSGRRDGVAGVAEDEDPLAGQVGAVNRVRVPRQAGGPGDKLAPAPRFRRLAPPPR